MNLHQLIKNISVELYSYYIKLLSSEFSNKEAKLINIFRETYIFLDCKNFPEQVEVKYYTDSRFANEEIIPNLIDPIIKLYITRAFSVDKTYMLNHCFIIALTSSLIIDYIQILAPHNERATDKQNTDKAVMELNVSVVILKRL